MLEERRRFKRYAVDAEEIQALVHPGPDVYPVKDIGKGGLAIEYTPLSGETIQSRTIDIISKDCDRFFLKGISCRTVYDIETLMEGRAFRGGSRRIRGLKFLELTQAQKSQLDSLIGQCFEGTPGESRDQGGDAEG